MTVGILLKCSKTLFCLVGSKTVGAGEFHYALGGISLSGVEIPADGVQVTLSGWTLKVKVSGIRAKILNFAWVFKQLSFPKMKDDGTADAQVDGLSVWLSFDTTRLRDGKVYIPFVIFRQVLIMSFAGTRLGECNY